MADGDLINESGTAAPIEATSAIPPEELERLTGDTAYGSPLRAYHDLDHLVHGLTEIRVWGANTGADTGGAGTGCATTGATGEGVATGATTGAATGAATGAGVATVAGGANPSGAFGANGLRNQPNAVGAGAGEGDGAAGSAAAGRAGAGGGSGCAGCATS